MTSQTSGKRLGPDFFIVGAPKCGTTSMDAYLAAHPDIYMAPKEQHFFGSDLGEIWKRPGQRVGRPSAEKYFGFFADTPEAARRGDSSVWYLWSQTAAREIHTYDSCARIIILLRNPVDMLASLHSQLLYDRVETLEDFSEALAAESDRRSGRRIPPSNGARPWRLFYRDIGRFHDQVERYIKTFGADQVHVVMQEDLARNREATYRDVLEFLGVDPNFRPDFRIVNANKRIRSRQLQRLVWEIGDEHSLLRRVGTRLVPVHRLRQTLLKHAVPALKQVNTMVEARPPLNAELRSQLAVELAPDVARLGRLLGRDLSHWCAAGGTDRTAAAARGQVRITGAG